MLLVMVVFLLVFAAGGLIWYLSRTTEFSRKDVAPASQTR